MNVEVWELLGANFPLFVLVGFIAQLVDGALGMAYGTLSSTVLLSLGVPPAQASAMIHAAECVTTGVSGFSHVTHRNVDWKLFARLAPAGIVGGVLGAYVLTSFDQLFLKACVVAYLACLGLVILRRAIRPLPDAPPRLKGAIPLGLVGGFLDASGGGGWGPVVASTLMGRGHTPRFVIGTVNTSEFFVTAAISSAFIWAVITGRLDVLGGLQGLGTAIGGLVLGGIIAAPLAGKITKLIPGRYLLGAVALVVITLATWQGIQLWPKLLAQELPARVLLEQAVLAFRH